MAHRRGAGARAAARAWPAHLVVFDVTHLDGTDLTPWPYARRRAALETLFADTPLRAPFTLCPSTPYCTGGTAMPHGRRGAMARATGV
ncbi:hypothetical protein [Streptomyces ambofaciens]|uniref:ATP-dependent DNA ligase n=1 Tax=Streptomyces ambofaciens TaxID=1889 RepID=UPI002FFCDB11